MIYWLKYGFLISFLFLLFILAIILVIYLLDYIQWKTFLIIAISMIVFSVLLFIILFLMDKRRSKLYSERLGSSNNTILDDETRKILDSLEEDERLREEIFKDEKIFKLVQENDELSSEEIKKIFTLNDKITALKREIEKRPIIRMKD